ncbi:MAG: hypothetical protein ACOC5T_05745 [Elusimicrobiota bacterium]
MKIETAIKISVGATFALLLVLFLTVMSPSSIQEQKMQNEEYIATNAENESYNISKQFNNIKNFITSYPNNILIGMTLIIISIVGSYYSKLQTKIGEFLRTIGPAQGYIFGFGIMLIIVSNPTMV